ncbi:MAG: polysaccharide biosynthesis protein [Schwartzia sp.]|nr:polysaccharide biosynthesis protein [Schwartzia sp. (in: firmicutes)]
MSEETQEKRSSTKGESLMKGTFILTIAGIVVKIIGSLNWIFVSRVLGGEGIGLYQMAFPIYFFALSVSTAGVPVAISIITAERVALKDIFGARRVFHISMALMLVTGVLFSLLTYFGAGWLIEYQFIRDPRAYYSVVVLAPAIFFVTLLASSRGYLQGWQRMTPTAVSQIVEQIFRVITMVMLAAYFLPMGLEYAAAGASFGACAGAITGLIVLVWYHWQLDRDIRRDYTPEELLPREDVPQESCREILVRLFKLALPVSAASIMLPVVSNLDLAIVPQRLEVAGYTVHQATELFGYLTGMAVPLINLSTIITASLAVSIIPALSEARAKEDSARIYDQTAAGIRISNFVCFPAFVLVCVLATPISTLIYNAPGAGPAVWACSFSIVLLGLHQVSTGILQGLGHPTIPMVNMILAAVAKVILNWTLTAIPTLGIMGAAFATAADMGVAAVINMFFIHKYIGYSMEWKHFFKAVCASAIMALSVKAFYDVTLAAWNINVVSIFGAVFVGGAVYIAAMLIVGGIGEADMARVPMLGRVAIRFLRRIGVFKTESADEEPGNGGDA